MIDIYFLINAALGFMLFKSIVSFSFLGFMGFQGTLMIFAIPMGAILLVIILFLKQLRNKK